MRKGELEKSKGGSINNRAFQVTQNPIYLMQRILATFDPIIVSAVAHHGLKLAMWRVLWSVQELGTETVGEISDATRVERSTLSRLLTVMQAKGLVDARQSSDDGRFVHVKLTSKGKKTYEEVLPVVANLVGWVLQDVADEENKELTSLLSRILQVLERPAFQTLFPAEGSARGAKAPANKVARKKVG